MSVRCLLRWPVVPGLLSLAVSCAFSQQSPVLPNAALPSAPVPSSLPGPGSLAPVVSVPASTLPSEEHVAKVAGSSNTVNEDHLGSTNVPMDSWIYPALERLGSMGLIPFQSVGIRPWTRQECRRQVRQAKEILAGVHGSYYDVDEGIQNEAEDLIPQLEAALAEPNESSQIVLESTYSRVGTIAGPALTDGFHFGETWRNDFGRPLGQGTSAIAGYSVRATYRRFFFYDRQEAQQSPTVRGLNTAQAAYLNSLDNTPLNVQGENPGPPILPFAAQDAYLRQRPLELYAGVAFIGNSLSFGKQQLFWGPTTMGPLSFSSNAEPTYNLRYVSTRNHPFPLFPELGTYRFDLIIGKLSGHHAPARPYYNGQKVDFTFGRLFEMSFTRWAILFGVGHPMTLHNLKDNLFSFNSTGCGYGYDDRCDPGDRKGDFDFRLHVPGLRNYVTLYADSYSDDQPSPLQAPRRAAWNPGVYFARLLYLPHADLRVEASSSEGLAHEETGTYFFINNQYRDGNTNKGFLLGNAVGRDSRAIETRSGYWFSAKTHVEAGFRQTKISSAFLAGGGTVSDVFLNSSVALSSSWHVETFAQYESFLVPSYLANRQHNASGWAQITWTPALSVSSK